MQKRNVEQQQQQPPDVTHKSITTTLEHEFQILLSLYAGEVFLTTDITGNFSVSHCNRHKL